MKKTFVAGAAAGASGLAVALPLLAQMAGAQSSSGTAVDIVKDLPVPSQACVSALAARDGTELSEIDTRMSAHKSALQARKTALEAAASITDDAQRQEAVKAAHEAFRTAMESSMGSPEDREEQMTALKEACGDAFRFAGKGGHMGMMGMHGKMEKHIRMLDPAALAEKLGMTEEELKAELDAGKMPHEIAEEKGIELPVRIEKHLFRGDVEAGSAVPVPAQ